ncbi:hypothetical protein [Thiolapillus sp.]|uniref:hypothetical protein n=1 Tax=Thiolapillus sp. TaxID=2017437 RepID=UPI003AF73DA3
MIDKCITKFFIQVDNNFRIRVRVKAMSLRPEHLPQLKVVEYLACRVPCDYIPKRSYPLFRTRQILNDWLTQNLEEA